MSRTHRSGHTVPSIQPNEIFKFHQNTTGIKLVVEWISTVGIICDLDVCVLFYDERARFIEKLNADKPISRDKSTKLEADIDCTTRASSHQEIVNIDLVSVDPNTSAIVLFVDGGERNFQLVQRLMVHCAQENVDRGDSLSKAAQGAFMTQALFSCASRTHKEAEGVVLSVLYKDGWNDDGSHCWRMKNLYDSVFIVTSREKDTHCAHVATAIVPAFEKYRPRLFPSVKSICSVLSSKSLPQLKEHFKTGARADGLNIKEFTETILRQLYATHAKVIEEEECSHTVAVIQEMFCQMNFNKDAVVDWDEFTSFCIQTDVSSTNMHTGTLDDYVIAYTQDNNIVCNGLTSYSPLVAMKYIPQEKRIMVIPESYDKVIIFNEKFELLSVLDPTKVPDAADPNEKIKIHDVIYIASKDLYTYCASDHSIVACREHSSFNKKRIHYTTVFKIFSSFLHLKLCWSEGSNTLCSVGADNMIFGWDIGSGDQIPVFHISRHRDVITDFIAVDDLDIYITCSLDKKIVLWSQTSRRVKGVLMGHKRGVRCLSYAKGVLLSAGFECEARTWDLATKEPLLVLRGHRKPIVAAKIMSPPYSGSDLRAMTVDDDGEFRLWNILVRERSHSTGMAEVLQVFTLHIADAGSHQVAKVRFLELPYDPQYSQGGTYSNVIAGSPSLIHVTPEKNVSEFLPPVCICCSEASAVIMTGVGRSLLKYDISSGEFQSSFPNIESSDICCFGLDGYYGRKVYVGCSSGRLLLMNFTTGAILDSTMISSRSITCVDTMTEGSSNLVCVGSSDGRVTSLEELSGKLSVRGCAEQLIGDNCGIEHICAVESLKVIVAASGGKHWGVWDVTTFRRVLIIAELAIISGIEVLGASCDKRDIKETMTSGLPLENNHLLTLAVCVGTNIRIYTVDTFHAKITVTHCLLQKEPRYLTTMKILRCPNKRSLNYSSVNPNFPNSERSYGDAIVAATEEGYLVTWEATHLRSESIQRHSQYFTGSRYGLEPQSRAVTPRAEDTTTTDLSFLATTSLSDDESVGSHAGLLNDHDSESDSINVDQNTCGMGPTESAKVSVDDSLKVISAEALSRREQRELRVKMQSSLSQFRIITSNVNVMGDDSMLYATSICTFQAHNDSIPAIAALNDNGCIITVSLDGYHRIWNLDACCLGELPLPNIPDTMKSTKLFKDCPKEARWKFISESIPVLLSHKNFAKKLISSITEDSKIHNLSSVEVMSMRRGSRKAVVSAIDDNRTANIYKLRTQMLSVKSPNSESRCALLKDLRNCSPGTSDIDDGNNPVPRTGNGHRVISTKWQSQTCPDSSNAPDKRCSTAPNKLFPPQAARGRARPKTASVSKRSNNRAPSTSNDSLPQCMTKPKTNNNQPLKLLGVGDSSESSVHSKTISRQESTDSMWSSPDKLVATEEAFSDHSIARGQSDGLIDTEGHKLLRSLSKSQDKKSAYKNSVPQMYLRNPKLSTQVEVPRLGTIDPTEVVFGTQKNMYKHANSNIAHSKKASSTAAQHAISVSRINHHLRSIGKMVRVDAPPIHEVTDLPGDIAGIDSTLMTTDSSAVITCSDGKTVCIDGESPETHKKLNLDRIKKLMTKVLHAETTGIPEWESRLMKKHYSNSKKAKALKRMTSSADANVAMLEKKLAASIRSTFSHTVGTTSAKSILTSRMLLPFYKLSDVQHFLHIFQKVDQDYSGDLDPEEWCEFFVALDKTVSRKQARTIFNRIDSSGNGCLSVKDLVPVVFSNANKSLQGTILKYVELELSKRKIFGKNFLKESDLDVLFEYYDVQGVGYILISTFREKVRPLQIPEAARYAILDHVKDIDDDEMLNAQEFIRIFRPYCM